MEQLYRYSGFNAGGKTISGTIEAPSEQGAFAELTGRGVTPVSLEAAEAGEAARATAKGKRGRARAPIAIRTQFVRELATFLQADVPLLEALVVLRGQEQHPQFRAILEDLCDRVQGGESFSRAMGEYPVVFSPVLISMVRVGETAGNMGAVLEQMAAWMENEEDVRREVRGAMTYPVVVLVFGVLTLFILLSFVLPRITAIFAGMEANLPLPTKILMGMSGFMGQWWWIVLGAGGALVWLARLALRTSAGKLLYDRLSLATPVFGPLATHAAVARFARASAALLGSGVPLLEGLRIVKGLMENSLMAQMVEQTIEEITGGQSLAKSLGKSPYLPDSAVHLLGVGERTGRLAEMFERVAQKFEKQTRARIKLMLELLSPLMILVLATMVGFIAVSILLPIFRMSQLIQ